MKKLLLISFLLFFSGCAVGNKYDYRAGSTTLPVKPSEHHILVLSVQDFRPYVLNGEREPSFVGIQRGGYGNPFDVTTSSGKSMTEDMAAAIEKSLKDAGYRIINVKGKVESGYLEDIAVENNAERIVLLEVYDWKSDIYMGVTIHCDLRLYVFDDKGELLAENTMQFEEEIGGAQIGAGKNSQLMAEEFAKRIGYMFNKKEVRGALR